MKNLFRYNDCNYYEEYTDADHLQLEKYKVIRETPKGYWINNGIKEKFVLKGEGKRFAYVNIELALKSYIKRKSRQISINKHSIRRAKHSLTIAKRLQGQIESL